MSSVHNTVQDLANFFEEKAQTKYLSDDESDSKKQSELEELKAEIDINTIKRRIRSGQGEELEGEKDERTIVHEVGTTGNFRQKLSQWKRREDYATATNAARQEIKAETNGEILVLTDISADSIKEYEVKRKLSTYKAEIKIKANAIKEQEQLNYKVVEVKTSLWATLCSNKLIQSECMDSKSIDRLLQDFSTILPANWMHHNQASKAIEQIENRHSSRMLAAITTGAEATSTESLSDDLWERKTQIDKECDASIESTKTQVAEAKKMTSGTKREIKNMGLMHKVAYNNSQGNFQPEAVVKIIEELTPTNSSSSSEESYKRMY